MKRFVLRFFAVFFFLLGTVGIFLPLLPTVPFYLLATFLLLKVSKREVVKLRRMPLLGRVGYAYIKRSLKRNRKAKLPHPMRL